MKLAILLHMYSCHPGWFVAQGDDDDDDDFDHAFGPSYNETTHEYQLNALSGNSWLFYVLLLSGLCCASLPSADSA